MGVGVAVGVAVGVLVGAAVAVGKGVALGAGADVGTDTGAQADNIRLTSKNTSNVRFILRVLLWQSSRPTARASPAPRSAAERRQVQARVGRRLKVQSLLIKQHNNLHRAEHAHSQKKTIHFRLDFLEAPYQIVFLNTLDSLDRLL